MGRRNNPIQMNEIEKILSQQKDHFTADDFELFWGDGYLEMFNGFPNDMAYNIVQKCIYPYLKHNKDRCLEIGCGGGMWTNNFLRNTFYGLIAIDVIPKSKRLGDEIIYYQLPDCDYTCSPIPDNSIDFVWCYGVFCHLPNEAVKTYVKNIKRVLKPDGHAVVMIPNWNNHPTLKEVPEVEREQYKTKLHPMGWFYIDMIEGDNLMPDFRDSLIHFTK